ncbi:MAG: SurA N-terminal domain-containing protein [Gammaproteobacteria bacterium]|nr:SurA N-terminal domain-containing protein [Gammaproteobacteria bacterium]
MFLQSMREKTQSWVAYVIVALLILSFALWGISSYFGGGQEKGPAAKVNGEEISYTSFVSAYNRFLQDTQTREGVNYTPEQQKYAKRLVLKSMIERFAIVQYITKNGFAVNQQQIDAALMSVPLFADHGEFSPALFKRFVMANGVTAQQFIADFSTKMTLAQWDEGLRITSFATPVELDSMINLLKQKRSIVYGVVKPSINGLAPISSLDAEKYYQNHQQNYLTAERVKISYITATLSDVIKSLHPTERDLITYYTQNSLRYDVPERWKVNVFNVTSSSSAVAVAAQLTAALAKGDALTSVSGVQINQKAVWLAADNLSPEIKQVLSQTKRNTTTAAFKVADNTYIVYQLLEHQAPVIKQYYEVKHQVQKAYLNEQANKKWAQILEEMSALSYEHPDSLAPLAEKFKYEVHTSNFFSHDYDGKAGIESNAEVITAAFSDDVLVGGNNSDVIKLDGGKTALVLRVVNKAPAHEQAFSDVESSIKKTLQNEHAIQRAKENAEVVRHALEDGKPIEEIQRTYGMILSKVSIGRFGQSVPSEVLQQAFMLPVRSSGVTKMKDGSFSVVQVLSITPGQASTVSAKEHAIYQNVIVNEWAQAELLAYVRAIMDDARVKIYQQELDANT